MNAERICILLSLLLALGCASELAMDNGQNTVKDSGWLASDSYEVEAVIRGTAVQQDSGDWSGLSLDEALQAKLVDKQIKFVKTAAESRGWRFNQLADTVRIVSVMEQGDNIYIEYEAVIDMLGRLNRGLPSLEDIEVRVFEAPVPLVPESFTLDHYRNCARSEKYTVRGHNFHYFFRPDLEECELPMTTAMVEITRVFERPIVYPEYDRLMKPLEDGKWGFNAALLPNRGDNDPMSRFDAHAGMLENAFGLEGESKESDLYTQYIFEQGNVRITIDLFNPTALPWGQNFDTHFRSRLMDYEFVHYNGHSNYGNKHLLDDPESFSPGYQIIMMHSCQSYAYYTRQVFRAKATASDPSGFDNADILSTGKSSYPSGAPRTLEVVLGSLLDGMDAIERGEPSEAPNWLDITEGMKESTWGDILYGVAGVRTNTWRP